MNNNVSLPKHQYAYLRTEFCNNLKPGTEGTIPCVIFGAEANPNRALGFHVLREDGALVAQVPLHALCWRKESPKRKLCELTPWDCFGHWLSVIEFAHLAGQPMNYRGPVPPGVESPFRVNFGEYLCTFDFLDNGFSDYPEQHKCLHLLKLEDGNFALQPNNRVQVLHKSFTDCLFGWRQPPQIETNTLDWSAERGD